MNAAQSRQVVRSGFFQASGSGGALPILLVVVILIVGLYVTLGGARSVGLALNGGTVTGLSFVSFYSNYPGLNGPAWLATITLNGNGQNLTGFNAAQLNGSYSTGTPVSINARVTNYGYKYTYSTSPAQYLYYWKVQPISGVQSSYTCPWGVACSQGLSGPVDTFTMIWAPSPFSSPISSALPSVEASYIQNCNAAGGQAILLNQNTYAIGGGTYGAQYECVKIGQLPLASIYVYSGSTTNIFNGTITVTNSTTSRSCSFSYQVQQCNITNQLYASLAGFSSTGQSYGTQQLPSVAQLVNTSLVPSMRFPVRNGQFIVVNPISTQSQLTGSEAPNFGGYITANPPAGPTAGTLYSNLTLVNVNNYNQQATSYLFNPVNGTSVFANLNSSQFNLNNPVALLNFYPISSLAPAFSAQVQIVAKFTTLGIGIPVIQPVIGGVQLPSQIGSATQVSATFTVQNKGSASGSVYVTGTCNGNGFGPSPSVPIAAGSSAQVPVTITAPINPNNVTSSYPCTATAYSGPQQSAAFPFNLQTQAQCGPGTLYVNPTTCKPIVNTVTVTTVCTGGGCGATTTVQACRQGYLYTNGLCQLNATCANPTYILNTSTNPPTCQPPPVGTFPAWVLVVIIVGAIVLGYMLLGGRRGMSGTAKPVGNTGGLRKVG